MMDPWIGFLNEEVDKRPALERSLGREFLRQTVLDRCATSFPFPLEVSFRGVVVGEADVDGVRHLLVGPTGLSGQALRVLGGVLVPSERKLFPGAVVDVTCNIVDPDEYELDEGILSLGGRFDVLVPLEP